MNLSVTETEQKFVSELIKQEIDLYYKLRNDFPKDKGIDKAIVVERLEIDPYYQ